MTETKLMEALRRRVDMEREAAGTGQVQFSLALKRDVAQVAAHPEWSGKRAAAALGLASSVVSRWRRSMRSPEGPSPEQEAFGNLKAVQIVSEECVATEGTLTLEFKNGAKVRGLTVDQLARLLEVTR